MGEKRRRWLRISLRALFVLVTALCCWLGWETSVVRSRRAVLAGIEKNPAFNVTTAKQYQGYYAAANAPVVVGGWTPDPPAKIPRVRQWLGDEAIQHINYMRWYGNFSEEELARLQKHFPEATTQELLPEPCHPGCFPAGTQVSTPLGPRAIEGIKVGDELSTMTSDGEPAATARVQSIFVTQNHIWRVETAAGHLYTTEIQPLCLRDGQIRAAGKLQPGDYLLFYSRGQRLSVEVAQVSRTERFETVYNLVLGNSEIFVANGFLARSKPPAE